MSSEDLYKEMGCLNIAHLVQLIDEPSGRIVEILRGEVQNLIIYESLLLKFHR